MDNETPEEKKHIDAEINNIKHKLFIHTTNARLTKEQIEDIYEQAIHQFGRKLTEEEQERFFGKRPNEQPPQEPEPGQDKPDEGQE